MLTLVPQLTNIIALSYSILHLCWQKGLWGLDYNSTMRPTRLSWISVLPCSLRWRVHSQQNRRRNTTIHNDSKDQMLLVLCASVLRNWPHKINWNAWAVRFFNKYKCVFEPIPHIDKLPNTTQSYSSPQKYHKVWQMLLWHHEDAGKIHPSNPSSTSPSFLVPKSDSTVLPHWVNDYHFLNSNTVLDSYPYHMSMISWQTALRDAFGATWIWWTHSSTPRYILMISISLQSPPPLALWVDSDASRP